MSNVKSSRKPSDHFKNKVKKVVKFEEVPDKEVTHSSIDMKSEINDECETDKISFW